MAYKFNPLIGNLDYYEPAKYTEYQNSDKPSPSAGDVWVKHTAPTGAGSPIGLLLSLTNTGSGIEKYELSYRTSAGTTKRVELT